MNKKVVQFVKDNLGKECIYNNNKCIIVGHDYESIIIGFYNNAGWSNTDDTDVIFIHSPMIISYLFVDIEDIKFV